jgi:hypothetical protein
MVKSCAGRRAAPGVTSNNVLLRCTGNLFCASERSAGPVQARAAAAGQCLSGLRFACMTPRCPDRVQQQRPKGVPHVAFLVFQSSLAPRRKILMGLAAGAARRPCRAWPRPSSIRPPRSTPPSWPSPIPKSRSASCTRPPAPWPSRDRLDPGRAPGHRPDQRHGRHPRPQDQDHQEDGASDWPTFAEKAKKLLENDRVAAVFGCWTSASRKAVLPVFEKDNGLLYYPTFYEGLEQSKNVIYTGQEATQQMLAGLNWVAKERRPRPSSWSARTTSGRAPRTRSRASTSRTCSRARWWARNTTRWATPVRLADQQDQAEEAGRASSPTWWAAPTWPSTSSSRPPASPPRPRTC